MSRKAARSREKPWITPGILKSICTKRTLLSKYHSKKDIQILTDLKNRRRLLKKLIKISKKKYYQHYFQENAHNIKKSWKQINNLLHRKNTSPQIVQLSVNGSLTSNEKIIANTFNKYFTNVANELSKNIPTPSNSFQDYLKNTNMNSIYLTESTPKEIFDIINSLSNSKSSDVFGITTKFVKVAAESISSPLSFLFNKSIQQSTFPQSLKIAKVIPLFKNESPLMVSNYRPISLLPIFSKIFEKLMYSRLMAFFERYKIISPHQYGFQTNKSTELAVNEICTYVKNTIEKTRTASGAHQTVY